MFLIGFRNRAQLFLSWFWNWLLNVRCARLITGEARLDVVIPRGDELRAAVRARETRPVMRGPS